MVYGVLKAALYTAYKIFFRFRCTGAERVPRQSDPRGVILAPNHVSFLDPPLVGIAVGRQVTFLAKEYLFRAFLIGWILRSIRALPIKTRSDDFRSIRELVRELRRGRCVVIFPEGTRSPDGSLQAPESGIGFVAVKSGCYVQPIYIEGTMDAFPRNSRMFRPHPVHVYFGEPFIPSEDAAILASADPYGETARRIMAEIARLKDGAEAKKV